MCFNLNCNITIAKDSWKRFNMKSIFCTLILLFFISSASFSQEKSFRLDLFSFFDNTEFGRSAVTIPQTMAGVIIAPEAGLLWDTVNKVNAGVSLLHEFGSSKAIDRFYPTAYYEYTRGPFRFMMGAFPRSGVLEKYPRLFFQDSISYYRPNINGLFWEYRKSKNYLNVWLDWTGRQSKTLNEAFFIGFSGRYNYGVFYLQHFGYMFHLAGKMDPVVEEALHDNILFHTSLGVDLSDRTFFRTLETNAGWVSRLERSRSDNTGWIKLNGFMMETRLEFKCFGIFNTFYSGDGMMYFYREKGNELYWGDPVYRARMYDRSDFYVTFIQRRAVNVILTYSLHFLEGRVYNEQMLKVNVNLNTLKL
jgi:hypothetical protein